MRTSRFISAVTIGALLVGLIPAKLLRANEAPSSSTHVRQELVGLRTANTKVFQTEAGKEYEVYAHPIHYKDQSGAWQDIRPQLATNPKGSKFAVHSTGVPYDASFADPSQTTEVQFGFKGTTMRFSPSDDLNGGVSLERGAHSVAYRKADNSVMYQYDLGGNSLKETVVLTEPVNHSDFSFDVEFDQGTPTEQSDESISVAGPDGQVAWTLAAPFAVDAAGSRAPSVTQRLISSGKNTRLVVHVDDAWLSDPGRIFPVTIDPTIIMTPDPADGMDVTLLKQKYTGSTSYSYVSTPYSDSLYVGENDIQGSNCLVAKTGDCYQTYVSLLKFGLNAIPKWSQAHSAKLRFQYYSTFGINGSNLTIQSAGRDWLEKTVAWSDPWSTDGPTADSGPAQSIPQQILGNWLELDVTNLVTQWLNVERPNYGIVLSKSSTNGTNVDQFYSSDATDPTKVPYLVIQTNEDWAAPTVLIESPTDGQTVSGSLAVTAKVTDVAPGAIDRVEFAVDGRTLGQSYGALVSDHVSLSDITGLTPGNHSLKVTAVDRVGHQTAQSVSFALSGPDSPGMPSALGIGNGKVQVAWPPVADSSATYNVYRGTTRDFIANVSSRIAAGLQTSTYIDTPPSSDATYFYRVTAVGSTTESVPTGSVVAVAGNTPTITVAFARNGVSVDSIPSIIREGSYNPIAPLSPTRNEWLRSTAGGAALGVQDGVTFTSTTALGGLVKAQLLQFSVLDTLNRNRALSGQSQLDLEALRGIIVGATLTWSGYGQGTSGTAIGSGARVRLWNGSTATYDMDTTQTASTIASSVVQADASQARQHLDGNGQVTALVEPTYSAGAAASASVVSDYALLTVRFQLASPDILTGGPIGNGQVLLSWKASGLSYRVYRSTNATFVPDASTQISGELTTNTYVDDVTNGVQPGQPYTYKVASTEPDGTVKVTSGVTVAPDPNPAAWVSYPDLSGLSQVGAGCGPNVPGVQQSRLGYAGDGGLAQPDGVFMTTNCTGTNSAQAFAPDFLTALQNQLGLGGLTTADFSSRISSMVIDWTGYGVVGAANDAKISVWTSAAGWQDIVTGLDFSSAGRAIAVVPNNLVADSYLRLVVRSGSNGSAATSLATDYIRIGVMLKPPVSLTAAKNGDGSVSLSWPGAGTFYVYRSTTSGSGYLRISPPVTRSFVDHPALTGKTLYYVIRPVGPNGDEGPQSAAVTVSALGRRFEENQGVVYQGPSDAWSTYNDAQASGGTYRLTYADVTYPTVVASFAFRGTGVSYVANMCHDLVGYGLVQVKIDGVSKGTYSLCAAYGWQRSAYAITDLPFGDHTIAISGASPSPSPDSRMGFNIDGFDVFDSALAMPASVTGTTGATSQISWGGASGAAGYNVYQSTDGGMWYRRLNGTPVAPGGQGNITYPLPAGTGGLFEVTAVDAQGNESLPSSPVALAAGVGQYDDSNRLIQYEGTWASSTEPNSYLSTLHTASTSGAKAKFTLTAGGFRVIGAKGPGYGIMELWRNGSLAASIDLYSSTVQSQQELYRMEGLTGSQLLELRYTGAKNSAATGTAVNLDAIEVLPGGQPWFLTAVGNLGRVSLAWTGTSAATQGYHVERATTSGGPYDRLTSSPISPTSFVDTTVSDGVTYYYVVRGVRSDGSTTASSNEVSVIPGGQKVGLDGRWPYVSLPIASMTGYVQLESGNLSVIATDLVVPAGPMAVVLRRTYNSMDPDSHHVGQGWRLNVDQRLTFQSNIAVWTDGDGSQTRFVRASDQDPFKAEDQTFLVLRPWQVGADSGWEIERKDGTVYRFTGEYLTSVIDRNGNHIDYQWVGDEVKTIQPSIGKAWTLIYNADGLLTEVDDGAGRQFKYQYDGQWLTDVEGPDQAHTQFAYTAGQLLVTDPEHRNTVLTFDLGRLASYQDGIGNTTYISYDTARTAVTNGLGQSTAFVMNSQGRLVQTIDAMGGVTNLTYDQAGNLTEVVDPLGRSTKASEYDGWGNAKTVTDALGGTVRSTFDGPYHQVSSVTDQLGRIERIEYDDHGNVTKITAADGTPDKQTTVFTYRSDGQRTTMVDPRAASEADPAYTTKYDYDPSSAWLTSVTDPTGAKTVMTYDDAGNVKTVTDPLGRTTSYGYDGSGRRTAVTYPDGAVESYHYDHSGLLIVQRDPLGAEIRYSYDGAGRLASHIDQLGGKTSYAYDAAGNLIATSDPLGNQVLTRYDALGRPTSVTDAEGNTTVTAYDAVGNVVRMVAPNGYTVTAIYDALNRRTQSTAPPATTTVQYDAVGNQKSVKDANGNTTTYAYDSVNRLTSVTDAMGGVTAYVYDKAGNRIVVVDANTHVKTSAYDALNRLVQETNGVGDMQQYIYDAAGQMVNSISGNGTVTNYVYDSRGNITDVYPEHTCEVVHYEYDAVGRRVVARNAQGLISYTYDAAGHVVSVTDPLGNTERYEYDAAGRRVAVQLAEGVWRYQYDKSGRMTSVVDPKGLQTTYTYTPDGRRLREILPYGITVQYTYDPDTNRLTGQAYQQSYVMGTKNVTLSYQYDSVGNLTSYSMDAHTWDSRNRDIVDYQASTYRYDALNRLSQSASGTFTTTYSYDKVGNRTSVTKSQQGWTDRFWYDGADRVTSVTRGDGTTDRYTYDGAGSLLISDTYSTDQTKLSHTQYDYNQENQLIRVTTGSKVTTYTYDAEGNRLSRKELDRSNIPNASTVYFQYLNGQVVAIRDGTGSATSLVTRGLGGELISLNSLVFVTDRLGSVLKLVDSNFQFQNSYQYDDFGTVVSSTESIKNDWKFTGAMYDSASGLYQLGARYYRPADGRFLTQDTYKGDPWQPWTQNLYVYVGNNPVNYTDPTGHEPSGIVTTIQEGILYVQVDGVFVQASSPEAQKYMSDMAAQAAADKAAAEAAAAACTANEGCRKLARELAISVVGGLITSLLWLGITHALTTAGEVHDPVGAVTTTGVPISVSGTSAPAAPATPSSTSTADSNPNSVGTGGGAKGILITAN